MLSSVMAHRVLQRFTLVTTLNVGYLESVLVLVIHCVALFCWICLSMRFMLISYKCNAYFELETEIRNL